MSSVYWICESLYKKKPMSHDLLKSISSWHERVRLPSEESLSLIWMLLSFLFKSVNTEMHYDYCHVKKCHALLPPSVYRHTHASFILDNTSSSIFLYRPSLMFYKETLVLVSFAFKILRESWCSGNARGLC
jgi:hypothetical protein